MASSGRDGPWELKAYTPYKPGGPMCMPSFMCFSAPVFWESLTKNQ